MSESVNQYQLGDEPFYPLPEESQEDMVIFGDPNEIHLPLSALLKYQEHATARFEKLKAERDRLAFEKQQLHDSAGIDEKTLLLTANTFEHRARSVMSRTTGSLILMDLDNFKMINHTLGYSTTDEEVLKPFARNIRANTREGDLAGRFGGEEFTYLAVGATPEDAVQIMNRLRFRANKIIFPDNKAVADRAYLGVSAGIAAYDISQNYREVFDRANDALTEAKKLPAKNSTLFYTDQPPKELE